MKQSIALVMRTENCQGYQPSGLRPRHAEASQFVGYADSNTCQHLITRYMAKQTAVSMAADKIQKLLQELQSDPRSKANNVVHLLAALSLPNQLEGILRSVIQGVKLFFVEAGLDGQLINSSQQESAQDQTSDPAAVYKAWLTRQYNNFIQALLSLCSKQECSASIQVIATSALMECVRSELGPGIISGSLFVRTLATICTSPGVKSEVYSLLFNKHMLFADIRYQTLITVKELAFRHTKATPAKAKAANTSQQAVSANHKQNGQAEAAPTQSDSDLGAAAGQLQLPLEDLCRNLFDILASVPPSLADCSGASEAENGGVDVTELKSWCGAAEAGIVAAKADKNESAKARRKRKAQEMQSGSSSNSNSQQQQQKALWANAKTQKRIYSEAWLALLGLPIPQDLLRKLLLLLHEQVIPNMTHPAMLSDFLTHCLDQGGLTGILALNGIFLLVSKHGLEYPSFYMRLYNLLTIDAFASKHRAQFFGLVDLFMTTPLIPAYTVAAIVKRLARLSLHANPAGALLSVAFIHNLIRRHPALMVMLHNPGASSGQEGAGSDPYLEQEADPGNSRAIESSLWEVEALRNHHCPLVATLCSVLDRDLSDKLKTTEVDIGQLLRESYASLFTQEVNRRIKQVPIAFYAQPPSGLFGPEFASEFEGWQLPSSIAAQ